MTNRITHALLTEVNSGLLSYAWCLGCGSVVFAATHDFLMPEDELRDHELVPIQANVKEWLEEQDIANDEKEE